MGFVIGILSAAMFLMLVRSWREGGSVLSASFLVMLYTTFLYVGSLHFYFAKGHLTFLFIAIVAAMYLLGLIVSSRTYKFHKGLLSDRLTMWSPLNPWILKVALLFLCILAICLAAFRFKEFGIPLLERTWYTTAMKNATGVTNQLSISLSGESLLLMGAVAYSLFRVTMKSHFKHLAVAFFIFYVAFKGLHGSKAAALMPMVFVGMLFFYTSRKTPKKFLISGGIFFIALTLVIGSFWVDESALAEGIFSLFYERLTSVAVLHLDYLLYDWAEVNSLQLGKTLLMEAHRVVAQITPLVKKPLFNEVIGNSRVGAHLERVINISPELSVFGVGYANFGLIGALLTAFSVGLITQRLNIYLLTCRKMNIFALVGWVYFLYILLGFVRAGNIIIALETYLINVVPITLFLTFFYMLFALPFPETLKWLKPVTFSPRRNTSLI